MKRFMLFIFALFSICIFVNCSSDDDNDQTNEVVTTHYYYYEGNKINLEPNTDFLFITFNDSTLLKKNAFIQQHFNLSSWGKSESGIEQNTAFGNYWAELEITSKEASYDVLFEKTKAIEEIQIVSPYFYTEDGSKVGVSNFFYVKLKSLADTVLLDEYNAMNKVVTYRPHNADPLWVILSCTSQTESHALDMANKYYESRLFKYAEPDFIIEEESDLH